MEKRDLLVKSVPIPIFDMFKGFCAMEGKSESEGVIDAIIAYIDEATGGKNKKLESIVAKYRATIAS